MRGYYFQGLLGDLIKKISKKANNDGIALEDWRWIKSELEIIEEQYYEDLLKERARNYEGIDGTELISWMANTIMRYVAIDVKDAFVVSLWILHTYLQESFEVSPYLLISSPTKRCGKTKLITLLSKLSCNALYSSNISPAGIYRIIELEKPLTLLIDEFDAVYNDRSETGEAFRGILNAGHYKNNAYVIRVDNGKPSKFSTYCSKAIAKIGNFPETIEDRGIKIEMERKRPDLKLEKIPQGKDAFFELKVAIFWWINTHKEEIEKAYSEIDILVENDRARDNFLPLLAVAKVISDELFQAIKTIFEGKKYEENEIEIQILRDIKEVFEEKGINEISTSELIEELCKDDTKPWATFSNGKPITPHKLGRILSKFHIQHHYTKDSNGKKVRGYSLDSFKNVFEKYLTPFLIGKSVKVFLSNPEAILHNFLNRIPKNQKCESVPDQYGSHSIPLLEGKNWGITTEEIEMVENDSGSQREHFLEHFEHFEHGGEGVKNENEGNGNLTLPKGTLLGRSIKMLENVARYFKGNTYPIVPPEEAGVNSISEDLAKKYIEEGWAKLIEPMDLEKARENLRLLFKEFGLYEEKNRDGDKGKEYPNSEKQTNLYKAIRNFSLNYKRKPKEIYKAGNIINGADFSPSTIDKLLEGGFIVPYDEEDTSYEDELPF